VEQHLTCSRCKVVKPNSEFRKVKGVTRTGKCIPCLRLYYKQVYQNRKDKHALACNNWNKKNPEKALVSKRKYDQKESTKTKAIVRVKQWRTQNKDRYNSIGAKYRASKLNATPKWLTDVDFERIKNCYKLAELQTQLTGNKWHVDHIYPLQGKEVCGLHVPNNLRAIPWLENVKKGNKLIEDNV